LGVKVAASTVWEILMASGIDPTRRRTGPTWSQFLRSQAEAILACDFFTADLLDGTQAYVLAVIEHASRRIRILGVTPHPTGEWTAQQARNLLMDLGGQAHRVKFMIRDRGSSFTAAFDAVLADAGIRTVLCNVGDASHERDRRTLDRRMPPRTPRPHPHLEPGPSAVDPASVRDPP
jgi:putative transposase